MKALRYLAYLAFVVAALVFWLLVAFFVFGWVPLAVAEPACSVEPQGCLPATGWEELFNLVIAYGALPATVLSFVFYRRWVRRRFGLEDGF
jgi:ABC-type branched-subunit amino acid transport system permease subunit